MTRKFWGNTKLISIWLQTTRHSTAIALLDATNNWFLNDGQINAILFLDLKKTFDIVDHAILLEKKLKHYGISDTA